VKFPHSIKYRKIEAKIYGKTPGNESYRLCYYSGGKRLTRHFKKFGDAVEEAERIVRDLAKGVFTLSDKQSQDALLALKRLEEFTLVTGRRETLEGIVSEYIAVAKRLGQVTLREAVDRYLETEIVIHRLDLEEAVEAFCKATAGRVVEKFAYQRENRLNRFAKTFQNLDVLDLTKQDIDIFFDHLSLSPKTRNHYRADVKQLLDWCVRKDYLPGTQRLSEADGLRVEPVTKGAIEFYQPRDFREILANADTDLFPCLAIAGLAGLRTSEILNLDWLQVWRTAGNIEVTAAVAKGRRRRLVTICPSLARLLKPFEGRVGPLWQATEQNFQKRVSNLCQEVGVTRVQNGLRHSFCTYHFGFNENENLTSKEAGNSPVILHRDYKGLATKAEAKEWFNISL
jgi:integrase